MAALAPTASRGLFFPAYATILLLFVLIGFSRTLYLRAWFPSDPLSASMYVHGIVLTARLPRTVGAMVRREF